MDSSIQAAPFAEEEAWDGGQDHRHLSSVSQLPQGSLRGLRAAGVCVQAAE